MKINLLIVSNYILKLNKPTVAIVYTFLLVSFLKLKVGIVMIFTQQGVKSFRSKGFINIGKYYVMLNFFFFRETIYNLHKL